MTDLLLEMKKELALIKSICENVLTLDSIKSKWIDKGYVDTLSVFERENDKILNISMVKIKPEYRKKGFARAIMRDLIEFADIKGYTTILTPEPQNRSISKENLVEFYRSLGFVPNKGKNKDFRFRETMLRIPQTKKQ